MKSELAALEELQTLDLKTLDLHNELKSIPDSLKEMREEVSRISALLDREKERLRETEEWRLEREKDVAAQSSMLGKSKAKLQGVRNEKEQKAAQREVDVIRKNIQDREDEAIKLMEAIEQYRSTIDEHEKEFAELEAQLKESEAEGMARMNELQSTINEIESKRSEITSRISEGSLRLYERIRKRLGRAVVEAKDGHCLGCNMEILAQTYNELQRGDKVYQCVNCFRILIFKPKENPEPSEK